MYFLSNILQNLKRMVVVILVHRPLIGLSVGVLVGIMISSIWNLHIGIYISFTVLVSVLGGAFFYYQRKGLFLILIFLGLVVGGLRFTWVDQENVSNLIRFKDKPLLFVVGEITSSPQIDGGRCTFDFTVSRIQQNREWLSLRPEKSRVEINLKSAKEKKEAHKLQRFDTILTSVHIKSISPPRNPGAFDYRTYLYRKQIHTLGEVDGLHNLTVLKKSIHPYVYIDRFREVLAEQIQSVYVDKDVGTIKGMLLGEREQVDSKLIDDYSTLGIIHLLSISGLHVGVLVATLYFLLRLTGLTRERVAIIILSMLPVYSILTGAGAPVVRACIMAMLALLAVILREYKETLSFLGVAFVMQVFWDPYQLFGAGFQLSFLITAALIICVPPLVRKQLTPWSGLNQAIAVTVVAQIASFPILIYYFHSFSVLSWLVNLMVVPLFSTVVIPLSILALFISLFSQFLGEFIASLSSFFLYVIECVSHFFLLFSWAHMNWAKPSVLWIIFYFIVAGYLWAAFSGSFYEKKHLVFSSVLFLGIIVYAHQAQNWVRDETRVTFLDVGQGDCAVIETKEGKTILIDGGGSPQFSRPAWQQRKHSYDVGKRVVVPYLQYRGIQHIDYLIMTHGDADHIGGLLAVVEKFPIDRVLRNGHTPHTKLEKSLMHMLRERRVKVVVPPVGLNWQLEREIQWWFLHPHSSQPLGDDCHTNDDSVVCLLSIYGKKVLMTGDIGVEAEKEIVSRWNVAPIDILKVAHHGSRYSTDEKWLEAIQARDAVISVGEKNRYGHPKQDVLNRLRDYHVSVFRTDQQGAITYHITSQGMKRESMLDTR